MTTEQSKGQQDMELFWCEAWETAYKNLAYSYFGKMPEKAHKRMMYCRRRAELAQQRWETAHPQTI